jgi:hypothetical protein
MMERCGHSFFMRRGAETHAVCQLSYRTIAATNKRTKVDQPQRQADHLETN